MNPRLRLVATILTLLLALGLPADAQRPPIRIGLLAPSTGPLAANGKEMVNGFIMFLEEHGNRLAGREVRLFTEDTESKPATALTKARALVESQNVQILVGPQSTAETYALLPYIESRKLPTLLPNVAAEDVTQRRRSPYVVRTGWSAGQASHPFGKWVHDTLKYRKVAIIGIDFAFSHEAAASFLRTFEEAGGQVTQKLWAPLGTADYAPYVARLRRDVDAVYGSFAGADALRFARHYAEGGLKERVSLIGSGTFTDEHVLRTMGDEALGIVSALHYSAALGTPASRRFVQAAEAKFGQVPSYYVEGSYVTGIVLKAALEAAGGDVEDGAKLLDALRRVSVADAPRGPLKFDEYGNPVQNIYVRKVERVGGRLQNTVIHTFPAVSQFWTYRPDEFLKNPVYSRDWPPCRAC